MTPDEAKFAAVICAKDPVALAEVVSQHVQILLRARSKAERDFRADICRAIKDNMGNQEVADAIWEYAKKTRGWA